MQPSHRSRRTEPRLLGGRTGTKDNAFHMSLRGLCTIRQAADVCMSSEPVPFGTANVSSAVIDARPAPAGEPDRVHVVFSIDTMSVGGTEMNAVRTAERLDRERYRLSVVTLRGEGPLAERYERIGVPVLRYPIRNLYGTETVRQGIRLELFLRDERV